MIPRLQAFYGGSPDAWWVMPVALLRSYLVMLPRLRAERALQAVSETMIGTGSMEKKHAQKTLKDWQREASGPQRVKKPMSEQELIDMHRSTGFFDVEIVGG